MPCILRLCDRASIARSTRLQMEDSMQVHCAASLLPIPTQRVGGCKCVWLTNEQVNTNAEGALFPILSHGSKLLNSKYVYRNKRQPSIQTNKKPLQTNLKIDAQEPYCLSTGSFSVRCTIRFGRNTRVHFEGVQGQ